MSLLHMPNTGFDPVGFYVFASWLHDTKPNSSSQELRRTIIGRAYYAALISARDFLGMSTVGERGHKGIVDALKSVSTQASGTLDALRLKRVDADYHPNINISPRDVEISLRNALVVLRTIKKAPTQPYSMNYLDPAKFL